VKSEKSREKKKEWQRSDLLPPPDILSEVRFPFYPPELTRLSAFRAAAQVSRASLRVGPTLGS